MPEDTQQQEPDADRTLEDETDAPQAESPGADSAAAEGAVEAVEAAEPEMDEALKCEVGVEDVATLRKKVSVRVPRERIDLKLDEMYGELRLTAQVPGFRVGRAPRRLVEKRFGKEVSHDVRNTLVGETLGEAAEQADLHTIGEPDFDLEAIELPEAGDLEYSFEVEVAPEFELPDLESIPVRRVTAEITDERIDGYLQQMLESRATYEATDEPAAEGDVVTADATVSGEGIEPSESEDLTLRAAPGQVQGLPLVDLGTALSGKKAGESAALSIKAPEAHPEESWRGKDLTVEVRIKQVRRRVLPELDEEFAQAAGFDGVAEMREFIGGQMRARVQDESRRLMREQISSYLLEHTDFDLPEGVAARHVEAVLRRRYVDLLHRGVPRERIDEQMTELRAAAEQQSKRELKLQFVLAKIIEAEGIEASDEEINSRIASMASSYNRRPERLRHELDQNGQLEEVGVSIREEKVLDKLLSAASVTEVSADEERSADGAGERADEGPADQDDGAEDA